MHFKNAVMTFYAIFFIGFAGVSECMQKNYVEFKSGGTKMELLKESQEITDDLLQKFGNAGSLTASERRKLANAFFIDHSGELEGISHIENFSILNKNDGFQIPVRLYQMNQAQKILLFAHGGGWIQGNLDTHDYLCRKIAKILDVNVLAVDYRLAPENPFPTPLEDVSSAYDWCCEKYDEIYVSGDSAGGNISAALCVKKGTEAQKKPDAMILFYPCLGDDFHNESYTKYAKMVPLSQLGAMFFMAQYKGNTERSDNKLITPNLETDMSVFPNTIVVSAECDVLLTEQSEFFQKMQSVGKECRQIIFKGAVHGFMTYGKEFDAHITEILRQVAEIMKTSES